MTKRPNQTPRFAVFYRAKCVGYTRALDRHIALIKVLERNPMANPRHINIVKA